MRIAIVGAGAIGSHIAARYARAGAEVGVVARGAQLAAIRARGITVEAPEERFTVPVRAEAEPGALGAQDAVLVTVKAPSLPEVAPLLAPLLGPETPVAFVLNGIPWWWGGRAVGRLDPGGVVAAAVPPARVLGGVVWSACTVTAPGTVRVQTAQSRLILGEPLGGASPRAARLAAALTPGGMTGEATEDIRTAVWTKLINNLTNGPICLLTRRDMRSTFADPVLLAAARRVMGEGLALAAALSHPVPGEAARTILRSVTIAHKPSILQDLEAGRALEFEALFEVPLDLARAAGVEVPTLELLVSLARQASGR